MITKEKLVSLIILFFALLGGLYAQTGTEKKSESQAKTEYDFPAGNYWSLDVGLGMSGIHADGITPHFVIDPRLWLSPALMVGVKAGIHYSFERDSVVQNLGDVLTLEGQVYMRWNFWRFGKNLDKQFNVFLQGGVGLLSAYRGTRNPFNEVTETRGSILGELALGVTIPLTSRWHLEPQVRGGYPHLWAFTVAAGYKFPLPSATYITEKSTQYIETVKALPPSEIVKRITIFAVEYVIFGPDIGSYNIGIDRDAQQLNELLLNGTAQMLREHPDYRVRIEGHANPYTINYSEAEELMVLSNMRANVVADLLREKGVKDEQMYVAAFGGTRNATNEWEIRNRNRRVEMMIMHVSEE